MRAARVHVFSESSEEDAWRKMEAWAGPLGLLEEGSGTRVFGRNTYPTTEPELYGYEFLLAIGPDVEPGEGIDVYETPGGLYTVLRFEGLDNIGEAWERMWDWIGGSGHKHVGWRKEEHGWCDGFEENLTPLEKDPAKWVFDLWVQLEE